MLARLYQTTEVNALKSESKSAIKELAEVQSELLQSKHDIKLLKSGCLEVNALKSESKSAIKELAEVQSELLQSKHDQIYFQNRVQSTIKTELKSYSEAVKKSKNEQVTLKKIKTVVKDIVDMKIAVEIS